MANCDSVSASERVALIKKYSAILVKLLKIEGFKVGESAVILAILANGERRL